MIVKWPLQDARRRQGLRSCRIPSRFAGRNPTAGGAQTVRVSVSGSGTESEVGWRIRRLFFEGRSVDVTEITAVRSGRLARARRRLAQPAAPPSLRAQLFLMVSVFLLGGVLSALLFVGIWRHTASDENQARAAQLAIGQELHATRATLARTASELAAARAAVAKARTERTQLAGELASLKHLNGRVATSLPPGLQAITTTAEILTRQGGKLETALTTLSDYLKNASATGVDPAFLAAQVRYLTSTTAATRAAASSLLGQARRAQATAAMLRQPH